MRPIFTMKAVPNFTSIEAKKSHEFDQYVSVPVWLQMSDSNMDDLVLANVYIQLHDSSDTGLIDEIIAALILEFDNDGIEVLD